MKRAISIVSEIDQRKGSENKFQKKFIEPVSDEEHKRRDKVNSRC